MKTEQSRFFTFLIALTIGLGIGVGNASYAQLMPTTDTEEVEPSELTEPVSKEAVREMVSRLSDAQVRDLLIQRLDAVAEQREEEENQDSVFDALSTAFTNVFNHAVESLGNIPLIPTVAAKLGGALVDLLQPRSLGFAMLVTGGAIALGVLIHFLVVFLFRQRKQKLIDQVATSLSGILRLVYGRLAIDVLGAIAFMFAAMQVIRRSTEPDSISFLFSYVFVTSCYGALMGYVISRFFFSPKIPQIRVCLTTDERAAKLTWHYALLAGYIVLIHNLFYLFTSVGVEAFGDWLLLDPIGYWMNLSMYAAAATVVWLNREGLSETLLENKKRVMLAIGDQAPKELSWFAVHWPKIAIALIVAQYILVEMVINSTTDIAVYSVAAVYMTFIVIFLWPGIDANISLFVARGISRSEEESEAASRARRNMQQGLLRVGRVMVVGLVLYTLASFWGVDLLDLAESGLGVQAAANLIELLLVVLLAYMVWELVTISIGYWLSFESGGDGHADEGGGEIGGVGLSRTATVLPILRRTMQVLIVLVSIIMVLDNWGVNIGPILAGAGVIGLAIGFGAQTLVKDIVSGLFFLADDAFRVGEYIDVGGTMGNVEKISLRSLRLRHHRGLVHTIPYGEIPKLSNYSRDWVIMKLRFRVPFDTDVNKVKKIFKNIGKELLDHPELGPDFLQPFKSQGVAEVDDNGIVVRGKFMAKPGKQFMIRKEVYVQVQKAFDEAGIPFARKQVMVHIPGLEKADDLSKDDIQNIGAAASEAAEDEVNQEEQDKDKKPSS